MKNLLFLYFLFLPFQFAINPAEGIDLALIRVFSIILLLLWLANGLTKRNLYIPLDYVSVFLYFFIATAFFSLFFAENITWGLRKLAFILSFFPIFLLVKALFKKNTDKEKLIKCISFSALIISIIAIIQFFLQFILGLDQILILWLNISKPFLGNTFGASVAQYSSWLVNIGAKDYMRAFAFFPDPHMFSFFTGMTLPLAISLATTHKNKFFYLTTPVIIFLADLLSFSRGGYMALLIAIVVFIFIYFKRKNKFNYKFFYISLLLLTIIFFSPVSKRLMSSFDFSEGSNSERLLNWQQGFSIFSSNPFGVGIGNYALELYPASDYRNPVYAHNTYLDIAAELGIIGLISWLGFIISSLWLTINKAGDLLRLGAFFSILIFAFHSFFDTAIFSVHILPLLLALTALYGEKTLS